MTELTEWLSKYGTLAGMLVAILVTNYRGIWVWGAVLKAEETRHAETKADRDRWQSTAFHALGLASSATTVLERRVP